mmetsp:Transcript_5055/g.10098  ORF Transcript_5055/g.10098 Transcript_5055/m.10098 type:complete len:123 (+) Transcript_5055:396-764(+)
MDSDSRKSRADRREKQRHPRTHTHTGRESQRKKERRSKKQKRNEMHAGERSRGHSMAGKRSKQARGNFHACSQKEIPEFSKCYCLHASPFLFIYQPSLDSGNRPVCSQLFAPLFVGPIGYLK